jgi:hypothetical protein
MTSNLSGLKFASIERGRVKINQCPSLYGKEGSLSNCKINYFPDNPNFIKAVKEINNE